MKTFATITVVALLAVAMFAMSRSASATETEAKIKTIYRVFRLSANEVAISCQNGADPTTYPKLHGEDALIISCGK